MNSWATSTMTSPGFSPLSAAGEPGCHLGDHHALDAVGDAEALAVFGVECDSVMPSTSCVIAAPGAAPVPGRRPAVAVIAWSG